MIIENSDALKVWLTSCLGRMCDADPAALAKYVLALVKKEKTESELREFCLDQLEVFLLKDTKQFVDLLFETLKTKSYLYKQDNSSVSSTTADATNNVSVSSIKKSSSSDSKEKTDSEKDSQKAENVPKSKPSHFSNSRLHGKMSGRSRRDSRDRRRSRSHSRSRSRSSSSRSSRSSSRERLKDKSDSSLKHKKELPKPEERRRELIHNNTNYSHIPYHLNNTKGSNRCKDYDEKGYCMQGDLCIYDHGTDPVVLENISGINFGVTLGTHVAANENSVVSAPLDITKSPMPPPPPTSPPPLPPPPPPLPPLPASGPYIPEPYNPEAPAMNLTTPSDMTNYWMPSNMSIPSLHHPRSHPLSGISNSQHMMPSHNSKPRSRELIGVPTVEVTENNKSISLKNISTAPNMKKRKGFDYSRLGPKPKRVNYDSGNRTLELKRVPRHLNTIALLNSHFTKFGNITNIEVFYNGDPEAALIQFQTHAEAALAHSSTDAVLNNRFIQVFWHKNEKNIKPEEKEKTENLTHLKEKASNVVIEKSADKMRLTNTPKVFNAEKSTPAPEKMPERSVVYSRGNICRTVFNHAVLKKPDISTSASSLGTQKEEKKVNKKLELYKKKQDFLESQMKYQKIILDKLSTAKNDKEKALLKQLLEDLGKKIKECQQDLKDFLKQANTQKTPIVSKTEAEKMLLDAELDLYNTLNKCDGDSQQDTAELLLMKVNELKQRAKALGLKDSLHSSHDTGLKPKRRHIPFPKSVNSATLLKLDNRPKTLLVSGMPDKDAVKRFFLQFGEMEKMEEKKTGIAVTFTTRKAAEKAFAGSKLGNENMSVTWYLEDQHSLSEDAKDANVPKKKDGNIDFVDEDEDEEEDSEARSWRR